MTPPLTRIGPRPPVVPERFTREELKTVAAALHFVAFECYREPEKSSSPEHRLAVLIQAGRKA